MDENDPFKEYFPNTIEQQLRRLISIDPRSERTQKNLKSMTVIKAETIRHLLFHPNKFHCFSSFRWVEVVSLFMKFNLQA